MTPIARPIAISIATAVAATATHAADKAASGAEYLPRMQIRDQTATQGGRSVRHEITVLREVTKDRDEKIVIVEAVVDTHPQENGPFWDGSFGVKKDGYHLFIPDIYHVDTELKADQPAARVILTNQAPATDGRTDRTVNEKIATEVSSSTSMTLDSALDLAKKGEFPFGKMPIQYQSGQKRTEERSVTMTLKDYAISSHSSKGKQAQTASWEYTLAPDIANNIDHFVVGYSKLGHALLGTTKMTPMMRRATLLGTSVWRLPGDYEGPLTVTTAARITNRIHSPYENQNVQKSDPGAGISLSTVVDMGSPYLARQPVVRLQSLSGTGDCLTQPDAGKTDVNMAACVGGDDIAEQQWYLDVDKSYRNVASKMCLTADPMLGTVRAEPCSSPLLNQQWEWRADRLHSMYVQGGSWRLHLRDRKPWAAFDPARHKAIPSNQYHALLRPWSSYPNAPSQGDVIPNLSGASPAIPSSYLSFGSVSTDQRWQVMPVHSGI